MNMDEAVQDLADKLDRALVVLDSDFSVLCYSVHDKGSDRARLTLALSQGDTGLDWPTLAKHKVSALSGPVTLPADDAYAARTVVPLVHDRTICGYLYFFAPDGASAEASQVMELVESDAQLIAMLAALRVAERRHDLSRWKPLIADLVCRHEPARRRAAGELIDSGAIDEAEQYSVLVFRNPRVTPVSATRLAVDAVLQFVTRSTTVRVVGTVLGDEGVLVFPRMVRPGRLENAMSAAGVEPVRAGVGGAVTSLAAAHGSHEQAQLAWRACVHDPDTYGRFAFWDRLHVDRLLARLPLDRLTAEDLPPLVTRLVTTPAAARLASTLESYLSNGCDAQHTARVLGISRSTLYYRLDRLHGMLDCDLSDGQVRRDLHVGMRVARMIGLLPSPA